MHLDKKCEKNRQNLTLRINTKILLTISYTGFVQFFKPKIQGLFKNFPGPYSEISRTILYMNLPTAKQNVCVESYVMGIERVLATKMNVFKNFVSISGLLYSLSENLISLAFI